MAPDHSPAPRRRPDLPGIAERLWRAPLTLAVVLFAASGPVHAVGHTDVVYHLVLAGLASGAVAVPLGLLGLRHEAAAADPEPPAGGSAAAEPPDADGAEGSPHA